MPAYSRKVQVPGKTADQLYARVSQDIDLFLSKASLGGAELTKDAEQKEIRIKHAMFTGGLKCSEGSLELSGNLSLFASPFRGKVDEAIDRWISKTFSV